MIDASGNSQEVARIPIVTYFDGGYKAVGIASLPKTMVDYAGHWRLEVAIDEGIGIYLIAIPNAMKEATRMERTTKRHDRTTTTPTGGGREHDQWLRPLGWGR